MINKNHPIIKVIRTELEKLSPKSLIYDLGTSKSYAKEVGYFKDILTKHQYLSMGYGKTECDLSGDILNLEIKTNTADAVLCFEVIEHVTNPFQALKEIHRILKPKGLLILTTPFLMPYHGKSQSLNDASHQSYPDFWRFTHQGLQLLCQDFAEVNILPFSSTVGYYLGLLPGLSWVSNFLHHSHRLGKPTSRHLVMARK